MAFIQSPAPGHKNSIHQVIEEFLYLSGIRAERKDDVFLTENFRRKSLDLDGGKYDDRFKRMWQYYLEVAAAVAFASAVATYQILFAKNYPEPMPLQRV